MNKHHLTKAALTLFALSLAFGNPAWAAEAKTQETGAKASAAPSTSVKLRFPDVASSHWATKHITKLALLGIVEGNEKGQYEPEASVTQEQVITMAIRMLGLEAEAKKMNVSSYVLPFDVSDYAKPYVIMALEKGLITAGEETEIAKTSGTGKWGARQATREWVAKLSVRTVGKQEEALKLSTSLSAFKDHSSISAWAVGYINEAVALKIVDGMEDGTFKPQNPVTRAQMATFLSRAGKVAPQTGGKTIIGVVDGIANGSLTVVDDLGVKSTYTLTSDTVYYGLNSEKAAQQSDIKPDNMVYLIVSEGQAMYAEVLEEQASASNTLEGVLVNLDTASATMTLKVDGTESVVGLLIPPTIVDGEGKGIPLSSLEPGWTLELKRTGSRAKYSSIVVKHIPVNKTAEGAVQSLNLTDRKLTVTEKGTGAVEYPLAEQVTYLVDGAAGDLAAIRSKDTISYQIKNDLITHIDMIAPYVEPSDSGKLVTDKNTEFVTLRRADNKLSVYAVTNQVEVEIPGLQYASPKDLELGDQVKVLYDDNNTATKIIVTSRAMKTEFLNTVMSYDDESKTLVVKNADGTPVLYQLSGETQYEMFGASSTEAAFKTYLTKGKKLDITASSTTRVKKVSFVYSYEGMVANLGADNALTLKVGDSTLPLKAYTGASVVFTNKTGQLSDLRVNDWVKVDLDSNQDKITQVQVNKTFTYWLTGKNDSGRVLTLKDAAGNTSSVTLASTAKIYNQAQNEISLIDLNADSPVLVTYSGTQVVRVAAAPYYKGTVTGVDTAGAKVTLTDYSGASQTVSVGSSLKVKREGSTANPSLSEVKAGDRVEIYKDSGGAYSIAIAKAIQKKVFLNDGTGKALSVYRETVNEQQNYTFHSRAYLHKGSELLAPTGIFVNDTVNLYIIDGKIVELEKL